MDKTKIIKETKLNRILEYHFKIGFIIISGSRAENSEEENNKNFESLKSNVREGGFSYIPVFGGYIEDERDDKNKLTGVKHEVVEKALIVPNRVLATSNYYSDDKKLFELGKELTKKYKQQDFLFKPKSDENITSYFDGNGKKTQTFKNVKENDLSQIFFTKLIRRKKQEDRRFTFTESIDKELIINFYINKSPQSVAEARSRYGEVFYGSKKEKQNE